MYPIERDEKGNWRGYYRMWIKKELFKRKYFTLNNWGHFFIVSESRRINSQKSKTCIKEYKESWDERRNQFKD
jgi:hypothetical protein